MSFHRRIRTIYAKELTDILRDRRTLIAMIVVPIVLYPLLMLGSVQAVSYQGETMRKESLRIGVARDEDRLRLTRLIMADAEELAAEKSRREAAGEKTDDLPTPLSSSKIEVFPIEADLRRAISERAVPVGIRIREDVFAEAIERTVKVEVLADEEEPRSRNALNRILDLLQRAKEGIVESRLEKASLPPSFVKPLEISTIDLSAPSSILGEVLPLILILMTITGAIYPAIDLTAGERERGTLESLMVCPVPVLDLIVGKFLVVTTVAVMGAALNLSSVTATVYFGGFSKIIATTGGRVPVGTMLFILLSLIPFAVLMSAIMIAVCSYARTFKEAQNYVTPVILAVLIPGGIAALPATRLEGLMLVMPVGNMVLLARDLLLGAAVPFWKTAMVLSSTTLYAAAAVSLAAGTFGRESVVFVDAASWKSALSRPLIRPSSAPGVSMGLLVISLLFPIWFFVQSAVASNESASYDAHLWATAWLMPLILLGIPVAVMVYWKVDLAASLRLRVPPIRFFLAALLIGVSAWVPAHELAVIQNLVLPTPEAALESLKGLAGHLRNMRAADVVLLLALIPSVCEELLFRGFVLSALGRSASRGTAIVVSAAIFGIFHFYVFRFPVTAGLGLVLGYLCWQSRSILPAILAHFLHNALSALTVASPEWAAKMGLHLDAESSTAAAHVPVSFLLVGAACFLLGILLCRNGGARQDIPPVISS